MPSALAEREEDSAPLDATIRTHHTPIQLLSNHHISILISMHSNPASEYGKTPTQTINRAPSATHPSRRRAGFDLPFELGSQALSRLSGS
jgi:hypothetical protein